MRFLGWWIGFLVLLATTRSLDLYLVVSLLTLMLAAFSLKRRNKFLWKLANALGADPAAYRLVATLGYLVGGTGSLVFGLVLSPAFPGRVLLALGLACYMRVVLNLIMTSQEPYIKRRWR